MSVRIDFKFSFIVDQMVSFEQNQNLGVLAVDTGQPVPPYFDFIEVIIHSLIRESFLVKSGTKIGQWKILTLQSKCNFVPLEIPSDLMTRCTLANNALQTYNKRKHLSETLSRLLMLKKNPIQENHESQLHSAKSRQIYVASLIDKAGVKSQFLPRDKRNFPKFPYQKLLENLNTVILSQYLIKSNMALDRADVEEIQKSDAYLNSIIQKLDESCEQAEVGEQFKLQDQLLFVEENVLGEKVLRLCLPEYFCSSILRNLHEHNKCHITTDNILRQYNTNFWTKGSGRLAKLVTNKCLHCKLNTSRRKLLVKGTAREFETDMTPGRVWIGDLLYLPKSVEGHRFCFVMTERLTSYVCGLPLKSLSTPQVMTAFSQFLSIMPQMEVMITDHGRGDFGPAFTQMCVEFGIRHGGSIPNRSQVQASCEVSNKILTNQVARICSSDNGKRHWPKSLAKAIPNS